MANWEIAVEKQMATWAFCVSEAGSRFIRGFRQEKSEWDPENAPLIRSLEHNVNSTLWNADPIYVTDEMMTLLEASWPQFEPEVFTEEDMFIPWGFVYLPRPIAIEDRRGKLISHRAIAWQPAKRDEDGALASFVTTWAETDDVENDDWFDRGDPRAMGIPRPDYSKIKRYFGQSLVLNYASPVMYGMTIPQMLENAEERVHYLENAPEGIDQEVWDRTAMEATTRLLTFLQALWRLLGQRVAVGFRSQPSRGFRRRAERQQYPEKYVTVVTLRRPRQPTNEESEGRHVEWSHRWLVSGHWRWQPYGDGTHKQIWISPYIKGPEEAPLVIRGARVFKWAR